MLRGSGSRAEMGRIGSLGVHKRPLKWKKKLFKKVLDYLASDSYMYAPLLSCPADPSSDKFFSSTGHSNYSTDLSEQSIHIASPDHLSEPPKTPGGTRKLLLKTLTCATRDQVDLLYANCPDSPSNLHPMVTRSKSGTLKFKPLYTSKEGSPSISGCSRSDFSNNALPRPVGTQNEVNG